MKVSYGDEIGFTLGSAIPLTYEEGEFIPKGNVYSRIFSMVRPNGEKYELAIVTGVTLQIFLGGKVENPH